MPAGRQAFSWHPSRSTRRQTTQRQTSLPLAPLSEHQEIDYTKTDKPSPGTPLGAPGDRLHKDRQAFPWHPSRSTRRQTTQRQTSLPLAPLSEHHETDYTKTSLPLAPLSEHQETGYTKTDKPSPGTPLGAPGDRLHKDKPSPGTPLGAPGDRLHTDRLAFPWHPSRSTRRQATHRQTSLLLAPLSEHQETDYTKTDKPSPGTPLGAPGDRLHTDRLAFPWHPSRSTRRQTTQRQAFPWHPSRSTRRQTTHRQTSLPPAPLSEHRETGYTQTDKPPPGTPLGAPGDKLYKKQARTESRGGKGGGEKGKQRGPYKGTTTTTAKTQRKNTEN